MSKFFTLDNFQYVYGKIKEIYATQDALGQTKSELALTKGDLATTQAGLETTQAGLATAQTDIEAVEAEVAALKDNTITQDELDAAIAEAGAISFMVVDELPEAGTNGVIYLVPHEENVDEGDDPIPTSYIQYIYQDEEWREIGQAKMDMSNFLTKTELEVATTEDIDAIMNPAEGDTPVVVE